MEKRFGFGAGFFIDWIGVNCVYVLKVSQNWSTLIWTSLIVLFQKLKGGCIHQTFDKTNEPAIVL